VGGDGSLKIIQQLATLSNSILVGIPKTINDVGFTEHSIGFDTVINTIVDAINRLTFTAASHSRVMILEVMGA
jgi:6-phosphofructokinase 1